MIDKSDTPEGWHEITYAISCGELTEWTSSSRNCPGNWARKAPAGLQIRSTAVRRLARWGRAQRLMKERDMAEAPGGPTVLRILLGTQLRRLREARGVTAHEAAEAIRGSE